MEALLNVTTKHWSNYDDRRVPPEIHTHDVLLGDLITLEANGQRYRVHVAEITPETITLEVEGLSPVNRYSTRPPSNLHGLRRFTLLRNSSLSLSIPMTDNGPTWTFEWTPGKVNASTVS